MVWAGNEGGLIIIYGQQQQQRERGKKKASKHFFFSSCVGFFLSLLKKQNKTPSLPPFQLLCPHLLPYVMAVALGLMLAMQGSHIHAVPKGVPSILISSIPWGHPHPNHGFTSGSTPTLSQPISLFLSCLWVPPCALPPVTALIFLPSLYAGVQREVGQGVEMETSGGISAVQNPLLCANGEKMQKPFIKTST